MDRQEAQALYAQAVAKEREEYLYQRALAKVKPVTRAMSEAEKEKYLQSQTFQNTLFQLKRRDKAYQALLKGELVMDYHQEEFDDLAGLIMAEGKADLPFLRSVERSRVPLAKAHAALQLLRDQIPQKVLESCKENYLRQAESKVERYLQRGDLISGLKIRRRPSAWRPM